MKTCDNIGRYDFECILQNQGHDEDFTFTQGDPATPLDLTQYQDIRLRVINDFNQTAKEFSLGEGLTISGDDDNVLLLRFEQELTLILTRPKYKYDIMFVNQDGSNFYVLEGSFTVNRTITR
jgi:hypothetical protein